MLKWPNRCLLVILGLFILLPVLVQAAEPAAEAGKQGAGSPSISFSEGMGDAVRREVGRVGKEFQQQAVSLFQRTPLGWDENTLDYLYRTALNLPLQLPDFIAHIIKQGRALGFAGSVVMLTFLVAIFYTLFGQKRVMLRVEQGLQPFRKYMPEPAYPYMLSLLKIIVASLIPLLLLGAFSIIHSSILYRATWFQLTGRLLGLWALGAMAIYLLREGLTAGLYPAASQFGMVLYKRARLVVMYIVCGMALYWGATAFNLPTDVQAFFRFAITLSVVCVLLLLFFNKKAVLSLLPQLPYQNYQTFFQKLDRYYRPAVYATFFTGILWCVGFHRFCSFLWIKTWAVAGVYVAGLVLLNIAQGKLNRWAQTSLAADDEEAQTFYKALKLLLLYTVITALSLIILDLLGALDPLKRVMSFPIVTIGETRLTLWLFTKAGLVILGFTFLSNLIRSYLGYKIYPALGIDTGLAYALNTFLKYLIMILAFLTALRVVGLSLRVLMVFAGAIGIGIGFGLQSMAANIISGLSLVFGRKIRKGDWIQMGDNIGVVSDIYLRATKLQTRDNIEYLIPNSDFISSTVINFTLSSPNIRLSVPVGVSYKSDPQLVKTVLETAASQHEEFMAHRPPKINFTGYGDSAINFTVMVWIDIRTVGRRHSRSKLYFSIFEALRTNNIEIPYPQRDIHIKNGGLS